MDNNNQSNEPIVIGVLRKQKTSKPIFAFVTLALMLGFTFALPYMGEVIKDENSFLGKIYFTFVDKPIVEKPIEIPEDEPLMLNDKTNIKFDGFILSNVILDNNTIKYSLRSNNESFDLDDDNYYLEIYSSTNSLVETINLYGTVNNVLEERTFTFKELKVNEGSTYFGKVVKLKLEDYQPVNLSGRANITCIKGGTEYKYTTDDEKLLIVSHTINNTNTSDIDAYLSEFEKHNKMSVDINKIKPDSSATIETNNGFMFTANLDLNKYNKNNLNELYDSKYFKLGSEAKVIIHDMKLEGYVCK